MASPHHKLFITAPEAAREIGLSIRTWQRLMDRGTIRFFTVQGVRGRFMHRYDAIALFRSMSQSLFEPGMPDMKRAGVSIPASDMTTQSRVVNI